jgi:hypothetical protein
VDLAERQAQVVDERAEALARLTRAGLPVARNRVVWLGGETDPEALRSLDERPLMVKAPRSAGGAVWATLPGDLQTLAPALSEGPYLLMERMPWTGGHLKVFVAGERTGGIERPFPALTARERRGTPIVVPRAAARIAREAARQLRIARCAVDLVPSPRGWVLVDVHVQPRDDNALARRWSP